MEVVEEKSSPIEVVYSVKFSKDEVEDLLNGVVKEVKKRARVKGFRPGRAPEELVKRLYQAEILELLIGELSKRVLDETAKKLEELKRDVIYGPEVEEFSGKTRSLKEFLESINEGLEVKVAYEFEPEFEPEGYKGIELKSITSEPTEEEIERSIENLRRSFAEVEDLVEERPAKEEDILVVSGALYKGDEVLEEFDDFSFVVGNPLFFRGIPGSLDTLKFVGAKIGDVMEVYLEKDGEKTDYKVKVIVKEIKSRVPISEEELIEKLGLKDREDLVRFVRDTIKNSAEKMKKDVERLQIKKALVEANRFELPKRFFKSLLERSVDETVRRLMSLGVPRDTAMERAKESLSDIAKDGAVDLAYLFIIKKIAKKEGIEVSDEEAIDWAYENLLKEEYRNKVSKEEFAGMISQDVLRDVKSRLLEEKVIEFIKSHSKEAAG